MTLFLAPEISALSAFTTVTRFPPRISFATFEQSLPAIWSVASILTNPPRWLASTIATGGGPFGGTFFFPAAPEKEYAPTTSFLVRSPEPKTLPGTRTAVAFETIPERWPRFTSTLLEEVVRSLSEASFQIAAFSFLPFRSSITAADLRRGFLVVITSRPH